MCQLDTVYTLWLNTQSIQCQQTGMHITAEQQVYTITPKCFIDTFTMILMLKIYCRWKKEQNFTSVLLYASGLVSNSLAIWFPVNLSYALDPVIFANSKGPPIPFSKVLHCSDVLESIQTGESRTLKQLWKIHFMHN